MQEDNAAFLEATLPAMDLVYNLARRCAPPGRDPEDLVQETYLRALKAWRSNRRPDRVEPWIATICLNLSRSEHRRRRRRPEEQLEPDPGREAPAAADAALEALASIEREALARALSDLPEEQRVAITLMDLCGRSAAEAAKILRCPRGTVLSRVHRGRKALAARLSRELIDREA